MVELDERSLQKDKLNREELADRIACLIQEDGIAEPIEGLRLTRASQPTERIYGVTKPSLCIIAQGAKEIYLADRRYRYDPGHYLLATVELPITAFVVEASPANPYLGMRLELDPALVGSVMVEAGPLPTSLQGNARPSSSARSSPTFLTPSFAWRALLIPLQRLD
jgi:hypothetical protein